MKKNLNEKIAYVIFLLCSIASVISIAAIVFFIFINGMSLFSEVSIIDFMFGKEWKPMAEEPKFGIYPMVTGSVVITFFSALVGVPVGLLTGVFISEYASDKMQKILTPAVELLSGIPSVVYGFFGVIVLVPFISSVFGGRGGGNSMLAGVLVLVVMILPIIVTTSKTAISVVPKEYREGSYALGCSKEYTIYKVLIPAARSGILAGVILAMGRAIGETMAIILVTGNTPIVPNIFTDFSRAMTDPVRTLTANIALEMGYATGTHKSALFATAIVLLAFIMLLNILLNLVKRKGNIK
ncbi:MAG: phosphate ABC transporter permease subunit PstC [Lachnospirales bacterium]